MSRKGRVLTRTKIRNQDQRADGRGLLVRSNSDLPIYPDLESLSVPKTPIFYQLCLKNVESSIPAQFTYDLAEN